MRCANCGHSWYQDVSYADAPAEEPAPPPEEVTPATAARTGGDGGCPAPRPAFRFSQRRPSWTSRRRSRPATTPSRTVHRSARRCAAAAACARSPASPRGC
ncbi:hypothetical protein [Sphingomonas phyllosphaerae]|uniref:hypothetical protein n=1 Tax=Sphingomonas phyllosphaerae TaxID=257003 RepID=UPI003FA7A26A